MPRRTALLIGVSEYGEGIPPLSAAPNDVAAMQKVLENPKLGAFDEVKPLINPDLVTMQRKIRRLFINAEKEDLVLLFFSGHGITDDDNRLYLTTQGTSKDEYDAISVPASFVHNLSKNCYSKQQVIILDCCYSGAFAEGWQAKSVGIDFKKEFVGLEAEGRVVLTSSTATQTSFQQEEATLSLYTQYLVEGIETGAADEDRNGIIYVRELHKYAQTKVQEIKPKMKPDIILDREGYNIRLAYAPRDPEVEYRQLVEKYANHGEISDCRREVLKLEQKKCSISDEKAEEIINSVIEPFRRRLANLARYKAFRREVERQYPLDKKMEDDLRDWQQFVLGLEDEDVAKIQQQVISEVGKKQRQLPVFEFDVVTVDKSGQEVKRDRSQAQLFIEDLGNGVTLKMVAIPGGTFLRGSPKTEAESSDNERPQHQVTVQPFFLGKYPVTQAQWQAVASLPKVNRDLKPDPSRFKGANRPVERVSWYDAAEFCARLAKKTGREYRLPSEAEWEYACRAGNTTPFHFGETITTELANYNGNYSYSNGPKGEYREQTKTVGSFPANAFGLYDMHGNVWEWCADTWDENYKEAPVDGSAWLEDNDNDNQYRLLRGGSWGNNPGYCRCAYRSRYYPDDDNYVIGFRVVCGVARTQ